MLSDKVCDRFTIQQVLASNIATAKGITEQYEPAPQVITNARLLGTRILDKIPYAFFISSWYRCPRLNKLVGGAKNSQHPEGGTADLDSQDNASNRDIFHFIRTKCDFDQLIWEFGNSLVPQWVHVSYSATGNRNDVLVSYKDPATGKTKYKPYVYTPIKTNIK